MSLSSQLFIVFCLAPFGAYLFVVADEAIEKLFYKITMGGEDDK